MKVTRIRPPAPWTAADRARHRALREKFDKWKPSLEELVATGEYNKPVLNAQYFALTFLMHKLKKLREHEGKSLRDIAKETGIGKSALSRLETGQRINPTLNTLYRYAAALGHEIVLDLGTKVERNTLPATRNGPAKSRKAR